MVRKLSRGVVPGSPAAEAGTTFCLNLNPLDNEDRAIVAIIGKLSGRQADEKILIEFSDRLALLLKHDWNRAKREAKGLWFPFNYFMTPVRIQYKDWVKQNPPAVFTTT